MIWWTTIVAVLASVSSGFLLRHRLASEEAPLVPNARDAATYGFFFLFGIILSLLVRMMVVQGGFGADDPAGLTLLTFGLSGFFLGVLALLLPRITGERDPLGLHPKGMLRGAILGGLAYGTALIIVLVAHRLNDFLDFGPEEGARVQRSMQVFLESDDLLARLRLAMAVTIFVPIFEEMVYRGGVMSAFLCLTGRGLDPGAARRISVLGSALVFALSHERFTWLPVFVLGLALGALYARTRNLWAAIAFHAAHNGTALLWTLCFPPRE